MTIARPVRALIVAIVFAACVLIVHFAGSSPSKSSVFKLDSHERDPNLDREYPWFGLDSPGATS